LEVKLKKDKEKHKYFQSIRLMLKRFYEKVNGFVQIERWTGPCKTYSVVRVKLRNTLNFYGGGVAKWLTCQTSNLRIADRVGSNPVRGKPLFH
jgi:hypothetical protein